MTTIHRLPERPLKRLSEYPLIVRMMIVLTYFVIGSTLLLISTLLILATKAIIIKYG